MVIIKIKSPFSRKKKPFSEIVTEDSQDMIMQKEKIMPNEKNFPVGAFNRKKGSGR